MVPATPLKKRSYPLERRKDKTVTETITEIQTQTINETYTVHITTQIFSTIYSTITVPTTIDHTVTVNVSVPTTTTLEASPPPSIVSMYNMLSAARVAPELVASRASSTMLALSELPLLFASLSRAAKTSNQSPTPIPATTSSTSTLAPTPATLAPAASGSSDSPSVSTASRKHALPATTILAIVLGALAFVGLLLAALLFARRMYRMYRQQRVLRKQIQTEGNEMPVVVVCKDAGDGDEAEARTEARSPGDRGGIGGVVGGAKAAEAWERYPPAYHV
ncbi:MAG: hypothetical protein Q9217_000879 [Psora testacea]